MTQEQERVVKLTLQVQELSDVIDDARKWSPIENGDSVRLEQTRRILEAQRVELSDEWRAACDRLRELEESGP